MLSSENELDLSHHVFERKLRHLSNRNNLTIVTPSHWLADCTRQSRLFSGNRIEVIPNIIDTDVFHPIRKTVAREALGLSIEKKLILFGCDAGTKNFYKGWEYLATALHKMDLSGKEVIVFGQEKNNIEEEFNTKVHFLGRLHDEKTSLALAYSAADVFVSPSVAEAFGMTLAEAQACETPAVCFNVNGTPDVVLHKQTGYLAKYKNSEDLARGIEWVLESDHYDELAQKAREHIVSHCTPDVVINQHKRLLTSLVDGQ